MIEAVYAKGVESGDNDKHGRPTMVEGEGEMNEEFIAQRLRDMMLLHNVVDVLRIIQGN